MKEKIHILGRKFSIVKNRYFLVLLGFAVWIFFFDVYSVPMHVKYWLKQRELKENKDFYTSRIAEVKEQKESLFKDDFALEKYAREELLMSKEGEDIYLIEEPVHE